MKYLKKYHIQTTAVTTPHALTSVNATVRTRYRSRIASSRYGSYSSGLPFAHPGIFSVRFA